MALSLLNKPEKATSKESSANSPKPQIDPQRANEVRSGVFVVACALTLFVLLFLSGQSQLLQGTKSYQIGYNYIGGLAENAPVHFAGHKVGKVTKIEFTGNTENAVLVHISISNKVVLRQDTQAYIDALGLMGEKYIELSIGTANSAAIEKNGFLRGEDPMPMMTIIKKGTEVLEQFERSGDAMEGIVGDLKVIVGENKTQIDGTIKNTHDITQNLKEMTDDLKKHPWKLVRKSKSPEEEGKKKHFFFF